MSEKKINRHSKATRTYFGSPPTFREELERLIHRHNKEKGSNTPDYMLADFLCTCLVAFDATVNARDRQCSNASREA